MSSKQRTLAVLLAALVVGSGFAMTSAASSHTTGNAPTADGLVVTSLSAPDSAAPNSTVEVSTTVTNPGSTETTELVEFRVAGTVADRQWVTVGPGEEVRVAFSAETTGIPPGEYIHGVFTERDGEFDTLNVSESFTVDSLDAPANATSGENITVDAAVSNPNAENATQDIEFRFAGGPLVEESLTLGANETTNVSLNVSLAGVAEGTYVHGLYTRDSGQQATLSVMPRNETNATVEPATVTFGDQSGDNGTVVVDSVTLPDGGFVAIHDESLLEGNVIGSVIGVSHPLEPGTYENLTVPLFTVPGGPMDELTENTTLIAMPHLDTNANNIYEFVISDGMEDGPYLSNGSAVTDAANVTVSTPELNETAPDDNATTPPGDNATTPPSDNETSPPGEVPGEGPGEAPGETEGDVPPSDENETPSSETADETATAEESDTATPAATVSPVSLSDLAALLASFL